VASTSVAYLATAKLGHRALVHTRHRSLIISSLTRRILHQKPGYRIVPHHPFTRSPLDQASLKSRRSDAGRFGSGTHFLTVPGNREICEYFHLPPSY